MASPSYYPGGAIAPSRFVKQSTTADYTVLQADANADVVGISQVGTKHAPGLSSDTNAASAAGDPIKTYGVGQTCLLEIGTGGVVRGNYLKSDANGCGVPAAITGTTMQNVGAKALESGAAADLIMVEIIRFKYIPALS